MGWRPYFVLLLLMDGCLADVNVKASTVSKVASILAEVADGNGFSQGADPVNAVGGFLSKVSIVISVILVAIGCVISFWLRSRHDERHKTGLIYSGIASLGLIGLAVGDTLIYTLLIHVTTSQTPYERDLHKMAVAGLAALWFGFFIAIVRMLFIGSDLLSAYFLLGHVSLAITILVIAQTGIAAMLGQSTLVPTASGHFVNVTLLSTSAAYYGGSMSSLIGMTTFTALLPLVETMISNERNVMQVLRVFSAGCVAFGTFLAAATPIMSDATADLMDLATAASWQILHNWFNLAAFASMYVYGLVIAIDTCWNKETKCGYAAYLGPILQSVAALAILVASGFIGFEANFAVTFPYITGWLQAVELMEGIGEYLMVIGLGLTMTFRFNPKDQQKIIALLGRH